MCCNGFLGPTRSRNISANSGPVAAFAVNQIGVAAGPGWAGKSTERMLYARRAASLQA